MGLTTRGVLLAGAMVLAALLPIASAGTVQQTVGSQCTGADVPGPVCFAIDALFEGLKRPGVSAGDFTADATATIEVADFYFAPRAAVVRDGQTVVFKNINLAGGNRHSVVSSDWGGPDPVLPVPGAGTGGGAGFSSSVLQPGSSLLVSVDISTMDPDAYVPLGGGRFLVSYHCYIHTATVMQGQLIVQT